MKSKTAYMMTGAFFAAALLFGQIAVAQEQQRNAGGEADFRQPAPEKQVTITAIPGVIAAGVQWKLLWQGPDNADGIVGTKDGGLLFAQEQPSLVSKLDKNGKFSVWARNTHGTGALGIDYKGRVIGVERTCTDPGGHPDQCHEPSQVIVITPHGITPLATNYNGKTFYRLGELVCDSKGGIYFKDDNAATYFVDAAGKVSLVADKSIRTNGMMLSRDEKNLYVTNGKTLMVFDIGADGTATNPREFAKLEGGGNGDGMAIDSEGRLYVTTGDPGIQVFAPDGKYLGLIPLPRSASSVAFGGRDKKVLYAKGAGMKNPDGSEYRTAGRNDAKAIYKIDMIAQGYLGRVK